MLYNLLIIGVTRSFTGFKSLIQQEFLLALIFNLQVTLIKLGPIL